jgi:hypothetical protein
MVLGEANEGRRRRWRGAAGAAASLEGVCPMRQHQARVAGVAFIMALRDGAALRSPEAEKADYSRCFAKAFFLKLMDNDEWWPPLGLPSS